MDALKERGNIMRKSRLLVRALVAGMLFILAIAGLLLTGCSGETTGGDAVSEDAKAGGTFSMYITEPQFIDPYNAGESEGLHVIHALFTPLVNPNILNPEIIEPGAALSWDINDDATVFTFKLDPDAKFADGTPVIADDFIYAFNRIVNPEAVNTMTGDVDPSTIATQLEPIAGFEDVQSGAADTLEGLVALDDHTLEITLANSFGDFIQSLMSRALVPVPRNLVENGVDFDGNTVPYGEMPIGNGPFMMEEPWRPRQFINVVKNPHYSGTAAYVDGISFRIFSNEDAAFTEFQAGNLDLSDISSGQLLAMQDQFGVAGNDGFTANPGAQVINGSLAGTYSIVLNNARAPFDNPDVRKAFALAINREAINDIVWESSRKLATDILPPGIPAHQEGAWEDARFDRDAAIQALEDAGYPGGAGLDSITLSFNAGSGHEPIMELIQADLEAIGITATLDSMEWATYLDALTSRNYQAGRQTWVAIGPSTDYFLHELFATGVTNNHTGFSNAEVDAGLAKARTIADADDRAAEYKHINGIIQAENPLIPIAYNANRKIASGRMNDLTVGSLNIVDYTSLWISPDQR